MNAPEATLTNGYVELPGGVLVLADSPEAGWQLRTRSNEQATADTELLAAPDYEARVRTACDAHVVQDGERG